MPTTSQLVPPCNPRHAYGLPRVRELSLRLEPVSHDTFGGLRRPSQQRLPRRFTHQPPEESPRMTSHRRYLRRIRTAAVLALCVPSVGVRRRACRPTRGRHQGRLSGSAVDREDRRHPR